MVATSILTPKLNSRSTTFTRSNGSIRSVTFCYQTIRARPEYLSFGEPLSGRRYQVRAAAYAASKMGGQTIGVETADAPLSQFLAALAMRTSGPAGLKLSDLARQVRFEVKVTLFYAAVCESGGKVGG